MVGGITLQGSSRPLVLSVCHPRIRRIEWVKLQSEDKGLSKLENKWGSPAKITGCVSSWRRNVSRINKYSPLVKRKQGIL